MTECLTMSHPNLNPLWWTQQVQSCCRSPLLFWGSPKGNELVPPRRLLWYKVKHLSLQRKALQRMQKVRVWVLLFPDPFIDIFLTEPVIVLLPDWLFKFSISVPNTLSAWPRFFPQNSMHNNLAFQFHLVVPVLVDVLWVEIQMLAEILVSDFSGKIIVLPAWWVLHTEPHKIDDVTTGL